MKMSFLVFLGSLVLTTQAMAGLNVQLSCGAGPTRADDIYQVYTINNRLLARTTFTQPDVCLGGGCGGETELVYEGRLDKTPIILKRSAVEFIELSALPETPGQVIQITSTLKGDSRFGQKDFVSKQKCRVVR